MRKMVLVASMVAALTAVHPAAAVAETGAERVVVDIVNGTSCMGRVTVTASPDNTYFHVFYERSQVHIGPYAQPYEWRQSCLVSLGVQVPGGAAYAIDRVVSGGYASLAPGAVLTHQARHHRTGQLPDQPFSVHTWTGPFDDVWQVADAFPAEDLFFPPCGTNPDFNIFFGMRLAAGTSDPTTETSFAALDSVDGPYGAIYYLRTRPC